MEGTPPSLPSTLMTSWPGEELGSEHSQLLQLSELPASFVREAPVSLLSSLCSCDGLLSLGSLKLRSFCSLCSGNGLSQTVLLGSGLPHTKPPILGMPQGH